MEYRNHNSRDVLKSPHYSKHISAMTGESLHSKAEIAEELAVRDMENAALKAELTSWKSVFGHLGTADECGNEWIALQDKLAAAILAEAVPQCTHEYEIDSDHPNHSCCQNCGEILKDGVHVQPVAQARSRAGMLAAAEECHKPNEYGFHRTCEEIYEAIREAAKK